MGNSQGKVEVKVWCSESPASTRMCRDQIPGLKRNRTALRLHYQPLEWQEWHPQQLEEMQKACKGRNSHGRLVLLLHRTHQCPNQRWQFQTHPGVFWCYQQNYTEVPDSSFGPKLLQSKITEKSLCYSIHHSVDSTMFPEGIRLPQQQQQQQKVKFSTLGKSQHGFWEGGHPHVWELPETSVNEQIGQIWIFRRGFFWDFLCACVF